MKGLLKFITCGSVDDGKSTLIGHILYDAKLLYADQEKALELDSRVGSREGAIDYSLLLDGLMAEREQGITIDVAYRYFTTNHRSFIVADTPGHEEYTRNMAVGASFAELAIILVDAKQGVLVQTRRHARICSMMGIRHFVFAVNKMDLIGYDREKFAAIEEQIQKLADELSLEQIKIIPVSATEGDNVTVKSEQIPWYEGEALLPYLEQVDIWEDLEEGFYMPVQRVCRPNHEFRGFQGQIEVGTIGVGDEVTALPSGERALVKSIYIGDKDTKEARKGQPVTIQLDKEVDVSRGCILFKDGNLQTAKEITAELLWMDDAPLTIGTDYLVKIGTRLIPGVLTGISYKININTGEHKDAGELKKNEIALAKVVLSEKIPVAVFSKHRTLGELIFINRISNMTSACGVVKEINTENGGEEPAFVHGTFKARGDVFEEFYYNLSVENIGKVKKERNTYTVGDTIPVKGESYEYPDSFDILILRDQVFVAVRNQRIDQIGSLSEYRYSGFPVVNGRGFAIRIFSQAEKDAFLQEMKEAAPDDEGTLLNKWMDFGTYRKVIFHSNYWVI